MRRPSKEKMYNNFTASSGTKKPAPTSRATSKIWVKKWVDYSSKYGLGYILSNGAAGVFFNDSTKIILDIKGQKFNYIERGPDRQDII
jgi:polo-like kinase 1